MSDENVESAPDERANEAMVRAIEGLPSELRRVFVMRYVQKIPRMEIATTLGIDDSEVMGLMAKALTAVRTGMDGHLDIGSPREIANYRQTLQRGGFDQASVDQIVDRHLTESPKH